MDQISILPVREQVAEVLRKAIFSGEFKGGQELSQEVVAKQLGISRMPVREALQILEREGLVVLQNRKTIVQEITPKDIKDQLEIRALLEGDAAARASSEGQDLKKIIEAHQLARKAVTVKDVSSFLIANKEFHQSIWAASNNLQLETLLNQLWNGVSTYFLPRLFPNQIETSIKEHQMILDAIIEGNSMKARETMQSHLLRNIDDFYEHIIKIKNENN